MSFLGGSGSLSSIRIERQTASTSEQAAVTASSGSLSRFGRARDLDLDGIEIERRDLGDKRFDDGARTSALRENGPAADHHDRPAVGRQGGIEMLADGIRLVWRREILTRIADLLDDPAEIRFALTVGVSGHLAKELRRRRHPRTASDPHIEAAVEEELLDFGSGPIDADRRRDVVPAAARDRIHQRLDHERRKLLLCHAIARFAR